MEFFDYDPVTGITEYVAFEDGKVIYHQEQDVKPYLDAAAELRNSGVCDDNWKKYGATIYAMLPPIVVADFFKRGINLMDPTAVNRVLHEINTNYSYCKTTDKHHEVK